MPVTRTAKRALVRSHRKLVTNLKRKRQFRSTVKDYKTAPTADGYKLAVSMVDKAAKWNLIHKNTAARIKSQLSRMMGE